MKLVCARMSHYGDAEKPCEEAEQLPFLYVDRRTVDDPKKNRFLTDWYNIGKNHRVENGKIARDFPEEQRWYVTLNSLEDLQAFITRHGGDFGKVVIKTNNDSTAPYLVIEIYDAYRE